MMINEQLFSLYRSHSAGINVLYDELDAQDVTAYEGPLLAYCWEDQYLKSKYKLVVIGQETNGWYDDYMRSDENIREAMEYPKGFEMGKRYRRSPFWRYAHQFNYDLNGFDDLNFIWINVNKFGRSPRPGRPGRGRPDQSVLDKEVEHYNILAEELAILKPDVCLFFTGPYYDNDIQRKLPDVSFQKFGDYELNHVAQLSSVHLPKHSYRTYHPGYGNFHSNEYKDMLRAILEECKR
ncbi:MAG: hypothetical protein ACTTJ0_01375 [Porphyromonas endodontalis]|uniref:hypothetical protein n=1 Tax=Porphyromonas endodontalis TaxID=28124 RepID=UPI003F9EE225